MLNVFERTRPEITAEMVMIIAEQVPARVAKEVAPVRYDSFALKINPSIAGIGSMIQR
jgi:hypothetical protein